MFAIYHQTGENCDLVKSVSIAGVLSAHIATVAETVVPKEENDALAWKLSGHDLCCAIREKFSFEQDPASCKVVVDATYTRADALVLDINHVWGFSYHDWTPILLRMSVLFKGDRPKGKATPVEHFRLDSQEEEFVHEFLYLQCGYGGGTRNWGRMGYTNAALLWPDAFAHLLGQIGFTQESR